MTPKNTWIQEAILLNPVAMVLPTGNTVIDFKNKDKAASMFNGVRSNGHVLQCNGINQYATLPTSTDFNTASTWSLCFWIKPIKTAGPTVATIFSRGAGATDKYIVELTDAETDTMEIRVTTANSGGSNHAITTDAAIAPGEEAMISIATLAAGAIQIWKNNTLLTNGASTDQAVVIAPFQIGRKDASTPQFFAGEISPIAIFDDRYLVQPVVDALYAVGLESPTHGGGGGGG
jgi:hypothetical protein